MKKVVLPVLLLIALLIAACGPAQPREDSAADTTTDTESITDELSDSDIAVAATPPPVESRPVPEYDEADLVATDSGLQYVILEEGSGDVAATGDTVLVNYTGWLTDGTQFDSSVDRGVPFPVTVGTGSVIAGWDEALALLPEGTRALLVLPPEIAYGETGSGTIPANSTLLFEVELVELQPIVRPVEVDADAYTETDSGLLYYDIEVGTGDMPTEDEEVEVEFIGWFENGTLLGNSAEAGVPLIFQLNSERMLTGIREGVSTMNVGGTRQIIVPAALLDGLGGVGPDETVTFELELVDARPVPQPVEVDEDEYTTLESGVKVYDIEVGDGPTPTEGESVTLDFVLWLADGEKIDDTASRGAPLSFPYGMGQMPLTGLEEGIADMQVGGKRQIVIPGEQAALAGLPGDQDSIFEVELLPNE